MSGRDTSRSEAPLTGRCHCGNLELALETSLRSEELSLRADTDRHGSRPGAARVARGRGSSPLMERVPRVEEIDV